MRKLFVPLAIVAVVFASCKKYETSEPLDLSNLEKVVVKGTVYADLDETTTNLQLAPAGTKVYVSVPFRQYNPKADTGNWISEPFTLGTDGQFAIEVPVLSKGVNAKISFEDFTYKVKRYNTAGTIESVEKYFSLADIAVNGLGSRANNEQPLKNISAKYTSIASSTGDSLVPTHTVNVTADFLYVHNDNPDTIEVPETKILAEITLVIDGETPAREYKIKKIVTTQNGKINLQVPMVKGGKASIKFTGEDFWTYTSGSTSKTYRYTLTSNNTASVYNQNYVLVKKYIFQRGSVIE